MTARVEHIGSATLYLGDSRVVLSDIADNSIDSVVTDPPYALVSIVKRFANSPRNERTENEENPYGRTGRGFMGQTWDTGETAFSAEFWREVMRVLKPGGHVIAASGTRTYHRLAVAIEDAGFDIRDMISWLYGSGFPKSHNQPGGWGTALKPACEPWVLARKPLIGTVAANIAQHGTGAINIEACRISTNEELRAGAGNIPMRHDPETPRANPGPKYDSSQAGNLGEFRRMPGAVPPNPNGRWPANVIHDGSDEVISGFPETASGVMKAGTRRAAQDHAGSVVYGVFGGDATSADTPGDCGSAARFFYSAKADEMDRLGSKHPTVKPVDLMQYLCRLVTPTGGIVLDPFAGSGTTGEAAFRGGFRSILIEREPAYFEDIVNRMRLVDAGPVTRRNATVSRRGKALAPGGLFATPTPEITPEVGS